MPAKKHRPNPDSLSGPKLIKEVSRRIRVAMKLWDAHRNAACKGERAKALALYGRLSAEERAQIPEQLRVWLRYRSEKYFGATKSGGNGAHEKVRKNARSDKANSGDEPQADSLDEWEGVGL